MSCRRWPSSWTEADFRFILTLKQSCARLLLLTPLRRESFRQELSLFSEWYNRFRPHTTLGGRTPNKVYHHRFPANRRPRYEPRSRWPRDSPCARPWALARKGPGAPLELELTFHAGRKHLPIVAIRRAA